MKKIILLSFMFTILLSCSKDDKLAEPVDEVKLNNKVNNFVWKAMNSWYNWQEDISNLADSKDDNINEYYTYLNSYGTPNDLFKSLLYKYQEVDKFSWFIEDYIEQEKAFQGTSTSFGFRPTSIKINDTNIILLVTKVSENSPASEKGLKRGDIIIGIDGQKFTTTNFDALIKNYYNETAEFILGENDGVTEKSKITLTKREVNDNAIQLAKIFNNINGKKVGYLVYNGFRSSYDKELNNAFANFKAEGIQELILDFRYNGGGSVLTCGYLASMIYGEGAAEQDVFAKTIYNKKHTDRSFLLPFLNGIFQYDSDGNYLEGQDIPLNRLTGLSKIYVITSSNTASASEMIINGLRPYIDVVTVGKTTYGKNVGSITLYDSPTTDYTDKSKANTTHKMAMQPITFQIFNKLNQSDYVNGFAADIDINEFASWDNFLPFGNENEILLKSVLDNIKGIASKAQKPSNIQVIDNLQKNRFEQEMYYESDFLKNINHLNL
ncbi:C-terminal processing protease CtpA/Prc, contains a PDZ domain [Tenacibaculum mesophilum]|uniref:PDZ domain-containing protein n=1 Tax=Tenacibaculum mesophilum TaxID=104268 RepID=A0ABM7CD09_9FLAO|nr:S41 family peptidase [Tenacibaculum mesophilum]AZJ31645.1 PDZ domain-containing protein [Tenacibaculum mesophilum]QFS26896.1 PDZ domain-containing protein [Tenacibaculum mesophilum]SHG01771.1 C-terminal processing protease CtpA/Prc, contains a PDZ domain [Tenacibaculum mesophilum]